MKLADPGALDQALERFYELHYARWETRGGSRALNPSVENVVAEAAAELLEHDRFRLWTVDVQGRSIAAMSFFAAGNELAPWISGFDQQWAKYQPTMATMLVAIEDSFSKGEARVNLGAGGQRSETARNAGRTDG